MKSTGEMGLKITLEQREFYRYGGAAAELERRGAGSSRASLAWVTRARKQERENADQPQTADSASKSG